VHEIPRGPEVLDEEHLAGGVAAGDGNHRGPHPLRTVVEAQAAGEEPVSISVVQDVPGLTPCHAKASGDAFGPHLDVVPGVADHGGLALRPRRGVDADHVLQGLGEQPEGVVIPEILLGREGQAGKILQGADIVRPKTALLHAAAKQRHPGMGSFDGGPQPRQLQALQIPARGGLHLAVPDHVNQPLPRRKNGVRAGATGPQLP